MKKLISLLLLLFNLGITTIQSQNSSIYNAKETTIKNKLLANNLDKLITKYAIFEIPIETIYKAIKSGSYEFNLNLGNKHSFEFYLTPNNILSSNYVLRSKEKSHFSKEHVTSTYMGYLQNDLSSRLRFSIRDGYFSGIIVQKNTTYCFEPLNKYIKGENNNKIIVYETKNINPNAVAECGEITPTKFLKEVNSSQKKGSVPNNKDINCLLIETAIAVDSTMLAKFGGDTSLLEAEIIDMLNLAEAFYSLDPLEIRYRLVETYIAAPNEITPEVEDDGSIILADFRNFGNSGGFSNTFGVATLWTNKNFHAGGNYSTAGMAHQPGVCRFFRYNIVEHLTPTLTQAHVSLLYTHELGHNWNAAHTAINSINIMSPVVSPTNTIWHSTNIASIIARKASVTCLLSCGLLFTHFSASDTLVCETTKITFTDASHGGPTTYQWSFPGGIPSSSANQTPVIQYDTAGTYDVTLIISDSTRADTLTISNYITVVVDTLIKPTITPSDSTTFCVGDSVILTSSMATNYLWSTTESSPSITVKNAGDYWVEISDVAGCTSLSDSTNVLLNPLPVTAFSLVIDAVYPSTNPFVLTGGLPVGGTYFGNGVNNGLFYPDSAGLGTHQITYSYTDSNSCINFSSLNIIVEMKNSDIAVYPNPVSHEIIVSFPMAKNNVEFTLTNNLGQLILKEQKQVIVKNEKIKLYIPSIPDGIYFLKITAGGTTVTEKIITRKN